MNCRASTDIDPGRGRRSGPAPAFTLVELLVTTFTVAACLAILLPTLARQRDGACRITCTSHLKQIGMGFKTWALDNTNSLPGSAVGSSGAAIPSARMEAFQRFQLMSNEISTPLILT